MADSWYSFGCVSSVLRCLLRCLAAPLTLTVNPYFLNDFVVVFGFCVKPMVTWLRSSVPLRVFFLFLLKIYIATTGTDIRKGRPMAVCIFFFCIKQLERMWLAKAWHGTMWHVKHVENPWAWGGQWRNQNGNVIKLYKIYMRTRVVRQCFSFQTCSLFHVVASK